LILVCSRRWFFVIRYKMIDVTTARHKYMAELLAEALL
jgi:hypothetical protein